MKSKAVLWVLLLVISINAFSLQHIFRLPLLVTHYLEHRRSAPAITFVYFLVMHYCDDNNNDNDQERHKQLPFKKLDFSHTLTVLFFQTSPQILTDLTPAKLSYPAPLTDRYFSQHLSGLFKPPMVPEIAST